MLPNSPFHECGPSQYLYFYYHLKWAIGVFYSRIWIQIMLPLWVFASALIPCVVLTPRIMLQQIAFRSFLFNLYFKFNVVN